MCNPKMKFEGTETVLVFFFITFQKKLSMYLLYYSDFILTSENNCKNWFL